MVLSTVRCSQLLAFVLAVSGGAQVHAQASDAPALGAANTLAADENATEAPAASDSVVIEDAPVVTPPAPPEAEPGYPPAPYYPEPPSQAIDSGVSPRYSYGTTARRRSREPGPGAREHDGLFMRFSLGFGAAQTSYREEVSGGRIEDVETSGLTALFDFAIGGRIAPNLLLHGNVMLSSVGGSRKLVDGVRDASYEISSSLSILGAGLTYYFMPANVYLSGIGGVAWSSEMRDELVIESGTGFGVALLLGKEWWVGPRGEWGVGAALRLSVISTPLDLAGVESLMRSGDVGIVFSATYN